MDVVPLHPPPAGPGHRVLHALAALTRRCGRALLRRLLALNDRAGRRCDRP